MKKTVIGFVIISMLCAGVSASAQNTLSRKEKKAGWKLLFDGKSTKGWHTYNRDTVGSRWQVKDGNIFFDLNQPRNGGGDLVTNEEYENYELNLEWKIAKGSNSGIIFDVQESKQVQATYLTGPEMQVLDNKDASDNKKQNHLAGCLYDMYGDSTISHPKPIGEWNQVKIIQNKGHLTLMLNGTTTYDGVIGSPEWNKLVENSKFKTIPTFAKVAKGKSVYRSIQVQVHGGISRSGSCKGGFKA